MKKILTSFCAAIVVLLMFVSPGVPVKAASEDCGCHDVTFIVGAEKNKMVSDLLKSDEFKSVKSGLMQKGYTFNGVSDIQVVKINKFNVIMIGIPFINSDGTLEMAAFMDGQFQGIAPTDEL